MLLWRFAAEAARAEAGGLAREAAVSASGGRLPQILDFTPVNDDAGQAPILIPDFGKAPKVAGALEARAQPSNRSEDRAPRVELRPELIGRMDNAA
jgi:hypothetical protein